MQMDTVKVNRATSQLNEASEKKPRQQAFSEAELLSLLGKYQMLPQLQREIAIDREIAAIACTEAEIAAAREQFYEQHQIGTETDRDLWIKQHYLTLEQFEDLVTRPLRIETFKRATWGHKLESYFLQRKPQLDQVLYSLIRTQNWNTAQELYFRIEAGEQSFGELARQYSQGAEAETSGVVGPVELGVPHPALAQQLAASQPGELLAPSRLGEWVIILRLEKRIPAKLDDYTRQRLLNELFEHWLREKALTVEF